MANIFDYLSWRGDLSFHQSPFNTVDALILCQLSYLPFDRIVGTPDQDTEITISEAAKIIKKKREKNTLDGYIMFKEDPEFLIALSQSSRYRDCVLHSYVNNIDEVQEKQFSAICIYTGTITFIAYRGTDASLVGWKEDLNMSFCDVIPSQLQAVSYLEKAAKNIIGPLLIGGHSKGGNLAVFAASSCSKKTAKRVKGIYSFDAPGFHHRLIASDGFLMIRDRINLYIPQSSVIGLLFEHGKEFIVIKSSQSGILQHDLYTWELSYNDIVRFESLTQSSHFVDRTLREWIGNMDYESRRKFIDTLFTILNATQAKSFVDMSTDWFKAAGKMIQTLGNIDNSTRKVIKKTIAALFDAARNNFDTLLKSNSKLKTSQSKSSAVTVNQQ